MYQPKFHPKVDKDLSKFDKNLRKDIRDKHIPKILQNPHNVGKTLTGKLAGLKSYSFTTIRKIPMKMIFPYMMIHSNNTTGMLK